SRRSQPPASGAGAGRDGWRRARVDGRATGVSDVGMRRRSREVGRAPKDRSRPRGGQSAGRPRPARLSWQHLRGGEAMRRVRVGNGCGFGGDNPDAPVALAEAGALDYLTLEYLAELTMSILALQRRRDPDAGFATDFLDVLGRLASALRAQPGLKVVTNAGGMNPRACASRARAVLDGAGLTNRRIAIVHGDDLLP